MSYLPSQETGYFEAIQVYYTALTDRLALFGARDRQLLEQWKEEGRPARLVCRGIREAVASFDDGVPRSLSQCERFVDEQWESHHERSVGRHGHKAPTSESQPAEKTDKTGGSDEAGPSSIYEQAKQAIEEAGKAASEERWRQAYRQAWRALKDVEEESERFGYMEVDAVEQALVDAYLEALHDEERGLLEESVASASAGLIQGMSSSAKREHLRIKTKQALLDSYELLDLVAAIGG